MADERLEAQPEKPSPPPVRLSVALHQYGHVPHLRLRRLGGRGSVRGSPCDEPARLRFTSLRPPSCGDSAGPCRCAPRFSYCGGTPGSIFRTGVAHAPSVHSSRYVAVFVKWSTKS